MAYEFTKLSEVEKLETVSDEANVLVEENGEIKRVAKTEVGGGKPYVLEITEEEMASIRDTTLTSNTNYDELLKTLEDGGTVIVKTPMTEPIPINVYQKVTSWGYVPAEMTGSIAHLSLFCLNTDVLFIINMPNGTLTPSL